MLDPETERKMKEHRCLYQGCEVILEPEFYPKGLCYPHLCQVIRRKREFPKEMFHVSYYD